MSGMIAAWTLATTLLVWWLARGKRWKIPVRIAVGLVAVLALVAATPVTGPAPQPPTQIVYRFDDHRYLELTGWRCEGALHYVDTKRSIRGEVFSQFARVFLPPITHADNDGDFIYLPYDDLSGFKVSKDQGKTFEMSTWIGTEPDVKEIKKVTVVNKQGFIEGKDGRLFMTSRPIGNRWGRNVIDVNNELPNTVYRDHEEFKNLPKLVPPVKEYKGWTEMHCDPSMPGIPDQDYLNYAAWQKKVMSILGKTVALPITLAMNLTSSAAGH